LAGHADTTPSFSAAQPSLSDLDRGAPTSPHLPPEAKKAAEDGIAAMGKNNFGAAETAFLKLLKFSPDNINGLINLGLVEFRLGRAEEAQKYLQRAIKIKPDAGLAWTMLGVIFMNQHDHEAATAALAQAVYLNPKSAQAHNYFAVTLAERGWYSGAEDELQKVIELEPNFADAHFNLALLYLQQSPPAVELARRHYQKALELGARPDPEVAAKLAAAPVPTSVP
jgi:tetratricopeptide (TPR) repeat protein